MARRPPAPDLVAQANPSDADVEAALAALPAEKLRAFVAAYLRGLDAPARRAFWTALVPSAARRPGARTTKRSADATLCEDIAAFVRTATRVGEGSPAAVDSFLERATWVFLNGDAALARRAFEAILRPLAAAEFSLGEDEMLEEVLSALLDEVVARYLVTVYLTTPAGDRPGAIWDALERFGNVGAVLQPLAAMERVAVAPLDDLSAFAAARATFLEGKTHGPRTGYGWDIGADRMLREAVARAHAGHVLLPGLLVALVGAAAVASPRRCSRDGPTCIGGNATSGATSHRGDCPLVDGRAIPSLDARSVLELKGYMRCTMELR